MLKKNQLLSIILLLFLILETISAQYKPQELIGTWQISRIGLLEIPTSQAARITIAEGKLLLQMPEGAMNINAEWTLKGDLKTMKINTETGGEELWKVENLTKTQLTLLDLKSDRLMILKKMNDRPLLLEEAPEPEDDGSGKYEKIAVKEHLLMGKWSFLRTEGSALALKKGDMLLELLENGGIILSYGSESTEGTWKPEDEHTSIEVTVNSHVEKWWLHQFSADEMKIVDKGVLFVFERK
jgi:hypothetical protein